MKPRFFVADDIYGPMVWFGHPDADIDPSPAPRLSRRDLMDGPGDDIGAELWDAVRVGLHVKATHPATFRRYLEAATPDRAGGSLSEDDAA